LLLYLEFDTPNWTVKLMGNMAKHLKVLRSCLLVLLLLGSPMFYAAVPKPPRLVQGKPDVLFIVVDDLNDWVSLLDPESPIKTPNIERLAQRGMLFTRAYCVSPACNPSRAATLTGLRPTTSGVYGNRSDWRRALPRRKTIMQRFQDTGYAVRGAGKIFHHHLGGAFHDPGSFHDFQPMAPQNMPPQKLNRAPEYGSRNTDWGVWPPNEADTIDVKTTRYCIDALKNPPSDKPLFLACGIFKPHSPFFAPREYHEGLADMVKPVRRSDDWDDLPSGARNLLRSKRWFWSGMMKLEERLPGSYDDFIRAYAACCVFADAQVGRLLDALDASPRRDNTIVVLWSDHGFHLGEKDHIEKFALWEKSNHIPFIIVAPGVTSPGSRCGRPVDMSVLYPTLLELAGLPADEQCDGKSVVALLKDPRAEWRQPALMTYGRGNHAVRSDRWRYIRYADGSQELYDHQSDPHEWTNLAGDPAFASVIQDHRSWIPDAEADAAPDLKKKGAAKNVLFIAIDDLRPALGCYGDPTAISPNIDRLAEGGIVFNRAYCQQAVCSPSRLSLLSGRRPDTIRVWDLNTHFREAMPDVITLPQHFRERGYTTRSIGKIFHGSGKPSRDPPSWSEAPLYDYVRDPTLRYATPENLKGTGLKRSAAESADVPDSTYTDGVVCKAAIDALKDIKQPFFLAVGFRKPHLPFCAPKRYWDLYQRDQIPPPVTTEHPQGAPEIAVRSWNELEGYKDIPSDADMPAAKVQELRHGYYACVSYVDALVGRLVDELGRLGLSDDTVVVLWGDHGYHLGEQGLWTKANNYELSTRVPLILCVPGSRAAGQKTDALVELVDVYPTLVEACGLEQPTGLEGRSLMPLLNDPLRRWKPAVFSQYPRMHEGHRHRGPGDIMGYAVRTHRFRYVEWQDWKTRDVLARELYDERTDPHEMRNLAANPEFSPRLEDLSQILSRGWAGVEVPE
jgi:arylsulfatase A-like enzyme